MPQQTYTSFMQGRKKRLVGLVICGIIIGVLIGSATGFVLGIVIGAAVGGLIGYGIHKAFDHYIEKREQQKPRFSELPDDDSSHGHTDSYGYSPRVVPVDGEGIGHNVYGYSPDALSGAGTYVALPVAEGTYAALPIVGRTAVTPLIHRPK